MSIIKKNKNMLFDDCKELSLLVLTHSLGNKNVSIQKMRILKRKVSDCIRRRKYVQR